MSRRRRLVQRVKRRARSVRDRLLHPAHRPFLADARYADALAAMRADDVVLSCYPRSGSTWLRYLLARYDLPSGEMDHVRMAKATPDLHEDAPDAWPVAPLPRLIKSHYPPSSLRARWLYLVRDPRDVTASYLHFLRHRRERDVGLEPLLAGEVWPCSWLEHARLALAARADRRVEVRVLRYEDLLADTERELVDLLRWLGREIVEERVAAAVAFASRDKVWSDVSARKNNPESGFGGGLAARAGGWRKELSVEDAARVLRVSAPVLPAFGYPRDASAAS